jgi:hypothetical protein
MGAFMGATASCPASRRNPATWSRGTLADLHCELASDPLNERAREWAAKLGAHCSADDPGFILALESGYLELQWLPGPGAWWATPDGVAWSELDLSPIGLTPDRWGSEAEGNPHFALGAVGDTAFITVEVLIFAGAVVRATGSGLGFSCSSAMIIHPCPVKRSRDVLQKSDILPSLFLLRLNIIKPSVVPPYRRRYSTPRHRKR